MSFNRISNAIIVAVQIQIVGDAVAVGVDRRCVRSIPDAITIEIFETGVHCFHCADDAIAISICVNQILIATFDQIADTIVVAVQITAIMNSVTVNIHWDLATECKHSASVTRPLKAVNTMQETSGFKGVVESGNTKVWIVCWLVARAEVDQSKGIIASCTGTSRISKVRYCVANDKGIGYRSSCRINATNIRKRSARCRVDVTDEHLCIGDRNSDSN